MQDKIGTTHVWAKLEVAHTTDDVLVLGVVKMAVNNLLGVREGAVEAAGKHECLSR